jgi:hypothetical protein
VPSAALSMVASKVSESWPGAPNSQPAIELYSGLRPSREPVNRQPHILVRKYARLLGRCSAGLEHADPTHADPAHANRRPHILVRNYAHLPGRCSVGLEDADPAHADPAHANPAHHAVKTA